MTEMGIDETDVIDEELEMAPDIPAIEAIEGMMEELRVLELRELVDMAQHALEVKKIAELSKARKAIQRMAEELDVPIEELMTDGGIAGIEASGTQLETGYRNPDNPKQTWSGKGRRPNWFTDAIGAGTSADSMKM